MELQRTASRARGIGRDVELVPPAEAARLMPAITTRSLYGAVWVPGDGHLDPHTATHALARAARALGGRVTTGVRVTGIDRSSSGSIEAVVTESGRIVTEVVVVAGGDWGAEIGANGGAQIVAAPVAPQAAGRGAVRGHKHPRGLRSSPD